MGTIWIVGITAAVLLLLVTIFFNKVIYARNMANNAFAGIDAYLKKRYDLIPNLVATVQQYVKHEKGILWEITALRTRAMNDNLTSEEKIEINNILTKAMHSLHVTMENYPDIKANSNFLQLQASLNEIEEQLSAARRAYNAAVNSYNNVIQMLPSNIIAMIMGLKPKSFFEVLETERKNIHLKELFAYENHR